MKPLRYNTRNVFAVFLLFIFFCSTARAQAIAPYTIAISSEDRTYFSWYFSNSENHKTVEKDGNVPAYFVIETMTNQKNILPIGLAPKERLKMVFTKKGNIILGDFAADYKNIIAKTQGMYSLFVDGTIISQALIIKNYTSGIWPDYVFDAGYNLAPLSQVEKFITENGHLPGIPSQKQIENEGLRAGKMAQLQMKKIEELTLYILENQARIEELEKKLESTEKK